MNAWPTLPCSQSQRVRSALSSAAAGWTDAEIDDVLQAEIPPDAYFNARGIYGDYHGGGNVLFEDPDILQWIVSKSR